jgi:hypothetical protein
LTGIVLSNSSLGLVLLTDLNLDSRFYDAGGGGDPIFIPRCGYTYKKLQNFPSRLKIKSLRIFSPELDFLSGSCRLWFFEQHGFLFLFQKIGPKMGEFPSCNPN